MGREFRLAGLLRLRDAQEAQAAGRLASANAGLRDGAARSARARAEAEDSAAEADSSATLLAIAAARASTRGMLVELDGLVATLESGARAAAEEHRAARRSAVALQKLGDRHAEERAREDLAREQTTLDELAARGPETGKGGDR